LLDRGGRLGPNPERETKPVEAVGRSSDRSAGRAKERLEVVGRRGGCGEPMSPLGRAERFERPVNPARVVRSAATRCGTVETRTETPGGASPDLGEQVGNDEKAARTDGSLIVR
jgi:hypothetical protein